MLNRVKLPCAYYNTWQFHYGILGRNLYISQLIFFPDPMTFIFRIGTDPTREEPIRLRK